MEAPQSSRWKGRRSSRGDVGSGPTFEGQTPYHFDGIPARPHVRFRHALLGSICCLMGGGDAQRNRREKQPGSALEHQVSKIDRLDTGWVSVGSLNFKISTDEGHAVGWVGHMQVQGDGLKSGTGLCGARRGRLRLAGWLGANAGIHLRAHMPGNT